MMEGSTVGSRSEAATTRRVVAPGSHGFGRLLPSIGFATSQPLVRATFLSNYFRYYSTSGQFDAQIVLTLAIKDFVFVSLAMSQVFIPLTGASSLGFENRYNHNNESVSSLTSIVSHMLSLTLCSGRCITL